MEINLRPYTGPHPWVFKATGALTGAMVTHIALRALDASPWSANGLALQAGASIVCTRIYPRFPGLVCKINPLIPGLFGFPVLASARIFNRVVYNHPIDVLDVVRAAYTLIPCLGVAFIVLALHGNMRLLYLTQLLNEGSRQVALEADKYELLSQYSNVAFTPEAAVAFADAFGSREDVTAQEATEVFTYLTRHFKNQLHSLSETTRQKLREHTQSERLTDPNTYKVLSFLAQATTEEVFPVSDKFVREAAVQSPEFYGEIMGRWLKNGSLLPPIVRSLRLGDATIDRFGSSYLRAFSDKVLKFDRPSKEAVDAIMPSLKRYFSPLRGHAVIQALSSALVYESTNYLQPLPVNGEPQTDEFKKWGRDVTRHFLTFCEPEDLIRFSRTCKRLHKFIVTQEGAPIWRAKGLGSLEAVRNMFQLAHRWKKYEIESEALALAVPRSLALRIGGEARFRAKLLRDEPNNERLTLDDVGSEGLTCLTRFGLPWNSIIPFCNKFSEYTVEGTDPWISFLALQVLYRIRQDHPHFDFRSVFSEETLNDIEDAFEEIEG